MFNIDFNHSTQGTIPLPQKKTATWSRLSNQQTADSTDNLTEILFSLPYFVALGMGEKYNSLNQKGQTTVNQVFEKFCFQGEKTYCPAPFFWTDSGFGLYVNTWRTTIFEFGPETIRIKFPANAEIIIFTGTPKEIISAYMNHFGQAKLPPKWSFGPWISANYWDSQAKVENVLQQLDRYIFPATVLVLEAWSDEATFYIFNEAIYTPQNGQDALTYQDFDFTQSRWPSPADMIDQLHNAGIRLILWQIPVYKKPADDEPANRQHEADIADAIERKLYVQESDGIPYTIPDGNWFGGSMIPDFTNPATRATWFAKRKYLTDIGVDGFKTDGGEFIYQDHLQFADGSNGRDGRNKYAHDYLTAYTDFLNNEQILFSRAGFGGQHTFPVHWAGDQQSTNNEFRAALTAGLSAAATGIPFWGFDIGGFAGALPTLDLYRRATQAACFCPIMQWHSEPVGGQFRELMPGSNGNNERSPWNLAALNAQPNYLEEIRFWHRLRMNLLPYLYSTALDCVEYSRPMIASLIYEWPHDPLAVGCDDEFILGESLLIAPLLEEQQTERYVYLPEGEWYSLFTHTRLSSGNQSFKISPYDHKSSNINPTNNKKQPLEYFPVFIRSGHGLALNLSEYLSLGSAVGNQCDTYCQLHFILAGDNGTYHFRDNCGNDMNICWQERMIVSDFTNNSAFTWEII